jgi:predicted metal-dependent hydrolase
MDQAGLRHGITLLNSAEYFEAHEVLEYVWRAALAPEKRFCQGMVQVAVALHHWSTGNMIGAKSVMTRAVHNLSGFPDAFAGIQLRKLEADLLTWLNSLENAASLSAPSVGWVDSIDPATKVSRYQG